MENMKEKIIEGEILSLLHDIAKLSPGFIQEFRNKAQNSAPGQENQGF